MVMTLYIYIFVLRLFPFLMVQGNAKAKFDETLEAHVRLGIEKGRSELVIFFSVCFAIICSIKFLFLEQRITIPNCSSSEQ